MGGEDRRARHRHTGPVSLSCQCISCQCNLPFCQSAEMGGVKKTAAPAMVTRGPVRFCLPV